MFLYRIVRILALAGTIIGGLALGATTANAAPVMPLQKLPGIGNVDINHLVEPAGHRKKYLKAKKRRKIRNRKLRRKHVRNHRKYRRHNRRYKRHRSYDRIDPGDVLLGVIIGNAIVNAPTYHDNRVYMPQAHVNSCYRRYRSYRLYDNTFQPYHGPRRPCVSRYWP